MVRWKVTVVGALAGATDGGVPIDDASAIADRLTQYETVVAHCDDANRQCEDLQAELASTRLQLENAQQETTRLKRLFAPKKKFAIDTTAPTHGLPQFPAGRSPRDSPTAQHSPTAEERSELSATSPTKESDEGESEEGSKAKELEDKQREKDEALRAKDPVAYETKQRLQARLSVRKVSLLCHHSAPLLLARLLINWACADCGLCACVQIDSRLAGI